MHFGITGEADKWSKKSRLSAYLMPTIGAVTLLSMCGILIFIYHESGPLPDDFNLAFWFFTFSLLYIFYKTQTGMIQYSLEQVQNIWPAMRMGLALLALSSVLLIVLALIPTKPTLASVVMCARVENRTPVDARNNFSMDDGSAVLFLKLRDVKGKHLLRMEWINPEGKLHFVNERHTHPKILAKYVPWWSYIYIKENLANIVPGNWRVDVFVDKEQVLTQSFSILKDGSAL